MILLGVVALLGLVTWGLASSNKPAFAQGAPDLPPIALDQVASGLVRPLQITHAGDGSERLFIVEQAGRIMIIDNQLIAEPFLDITDRVMSPESEGGNEQGLLGLAFPPGYAGKGYFYIYYTQLDGDNVLAKFSITGNPNQADPASEEQLLIFPHPDYSNHNGGQIVFGPDGYLYIGTGDGGGGGDPAGNAQNPASLSGKMLRIDVEMSPVKDALRVKGDFIIYLPIVGLTFEAVPPAYLIPPDNPFIDDPTYRPEIWALGLRNPWRFSFDSQNGDLYIADVGQNRWEEVNFQPTNNPGGQNYGWNIMEGEECYLSSTCDTAGLTLPVHVYPIFSSRNCAITGGYVYHGQAMPDLAGVYVFGDFCSGRIWGLQKTGGAWVSEEMASVPYRISAFGEDEAGEIYLADLSGGGIYQIVSP